MNGSSDLWNMAPSRKTKDISSSNYSIQNSYRSPSSSSNSFLKTISRIFTYYSNAQSPSTIWRRHAEQELIKLNLLNPIHASSSSSSSSSSEIHSTSMISSIFVLIKSTIGTSIYVLPYAFAHTGWFFGIIFLVCGCLINIFSLHLLALCSQLIHPASFYTLTKVTYPSVVIIIDAAIALDCVGTCIAYLVVIGGIMPQVMLEFLASGFLLEERFWITVAFVFCIPFGFIHHISAFKWTSALADLSVAFFCLILLLYSIPKSGLDPCGDETTDCTGNTTPFVFSIDTIKVFSIYSMAFNCQMQLFPVVNELKQPTTRREDIVVSSALLSTFVLYLIVAVCGYAAYGSVVSDSALESYPNNFATNLARILVSLQLVLSYPLVLLPGRESMVSIWHTLTHRESLIQKGYELNKYEHFQVNKLKKMENNSIERSVNDLEMNPSSSRSKRHEMSQEEEEGEEEDVENLHEGDSKREDEEVGEDADNIQLLDGMIREEQLMDGDTQQQEQDDNQGEHHQPLTNPISSSNVTLPSLQFEDIEKIKRQKNIHFLIATSLFLIFTYTIAMSSISLGLVTEILGATGAVLTTFILPGAFYIALYRHHSPSSVGMGRVSYTLRMIGAWVMVGIGFIMAPICLISLFF